MTIKLSASRLDLGNARLDNADLRGYSELQNALGNVSGATTIDLSLGTVITATVTAATTFSVTNIPSSTQYVSFTLVLTNGGRFTTTWMSGTKWQNSTAPTLSVIGTDVLTFFTTDNGTSWRGSVVMPAVSAGSQLFAWGYNRYGRFGFGDTNNRSSPTQISGVWTQRSGGGGSYTFWNLKTTGAAYGAGSGTFGQLGFGDTVKRSSPVQLAGTWISIKPTGPATNTEFTLGMRPDSSLWSWGRQNNSYGALGLGDSIARSSPAQITGTWSDMSPGNLSAIATRSADSSLWGWGWNFNGSLGLGDTVTRSSPTQIAGTWSSINFGRHTATAIKSDGSLWIWGQGTYGIHGLGDAISRSSPVQIPGTWQKIVVDQYNCIALRQNGTLWAWGRGNLGQLGLSDTINRSSPVQVGTGTWSDIAIVNNASMALSASGFLWVWGRNGYGDLGLPDLVNRSSPAQLAGTWVSVVGGQRFGAGIKI